MGYREELTNLVKTYTEDNIDITDNWDDWEKFLTNQDIIKSYDEVYEMDLDHLCSCGHDYGDTYITDSGEWDVESLIDNDEDITLMSNGCYFVHNQQYIDDYTIDLFYEQQEEKAKQQRLNWAINQAYIDLKESSNAFGRFDALLFVFGHDFGNQKVYFASDMDKVRRELLKCMKSVINLIDDSIYDGSIELWLPNHNVWSDAEDEHYCELIMFGGYEVLSDGQKILDSDAIILKDEESIRTLEYFTYENINQLCNYIGEVFEFYKNDCFNVGDKAYEQKINQKLNDIIDNYWMNTIEFDYAEFYSNM